MVIYFTIHYIYYVKFKPVPGWNDHCREKYRDARIAFLKWIECGRIRRSALFENMKVTSLDRCLLRPLTGVNETRNELQVRNWPFIYVIKMLISSGKK